LKHFGAWMNHGQTRIHKTHHGSNLGETTTFPLIIYFVHGHGISTQMSFCPETLKWESPNSQSWDSLTLGTHNFVCKPLIEMRFQTKLQPSLIAFQWYVTHHQHIRKSGRLLTFSGWGSNWQFDSQPFFWP
jgi:hypothetical protein